MATPWEYIIFHPQRSGYKLTPQGRYFMYYICGEGASGMIDIPY